LKSSKFKNGEAVLFDGEQVTIVNIIIYDGYNNEISYKDSDGYVDMDMELNFDKITKGRGKK